MIEVYLYMQQPPLFLNQIKEGGPVTITSKDMTRFFMSIPETINLILKATSLMQGRDVYILKMKSMRIIDLAEVLIEEYSEKLDRKKKIEIKETGIRPGEKTYEMLISEDEKEHIEDLGDMREHLNEHEAILDKLNSIKNETDKHYDKWHAQLNDLQRKLLFIDKTIFETKYV